LCFATASGANWNLIYKEIILGSFARNARNQRRVQLAALARRPPRIIRHRRDE
jgi:hypothetical protein